MAGPAIGEEDPYEVLGVSRDAAANELRKAYHALALRWHPDKQGPDARTAAETNFKAIGGAYAKLSDPGRRKAFDRAASVSGFRKKRANSPTARRPSSARPTSGPRGGRPQSAGTEPASWSAPRPTPKPGPSWERCTAPTLERPPHGRVWFARSSAAVGRAYKGMEGEEIARCRQKAFEEVGQWARRRPGTLLDIRGCTDKGEVSRQQQTALGQSRCEKAFRFLVDKCQVPDEQCRVSSIVGEDFQGVELRVLFRFEADGCFFERLEALQCEEPLDSLAAAALRVPGTMILVEVFGAVRAPGRLSQRRVAALRNGLEERGVHRKRLSGRVCEGATEEARFYLHQEPSSVE